MSFIQDYKWVILFYSTILLLVYIFRKKFDIQGKIMAMYRTKVGLKLMDKIGTKHSEVVKLIGYIGIGAGYVGLFTIVYFLLKNIITLLTIPSAVSAVSVVVPGVKIPGSPVEIPLITGWIALFLVILVHEFSHGVVARAHKLKVKSSGIFFLGPLMGAFVEPEEKKLRKASDTTQYSVYAAGPFSNIILALLCVLMLTYVFAPGLNAMETPLGIEIADVTDGFPAKEAGLKGGMTITSVNGNPVKTYEEFSNIVRRIKPNESVLITADGNDHSIYTVQSPNDPQQGYLGVMTSSKPKVELKSDSLFFLIAHKIIKWLASLFSITGLLSLGIGLANLLPLGPVDGGRMLQVTLEKIKGPDKGNRLWRQISIITLALLALNLFWPAIKWFGKLFI